MPTLKKIPTPVSGWPDKYVFYRFWYLVEIGCLLSQGSPEA